jgi:hypothetical protein
LTEQSTDTMTKRHPVHKPKILTEELRGLSEHFERRKARAMQRLESEKKQGWFFGIIGLECEVPSFDFAEQLVVFEEVEEPPGEIELARALIQPELFGAIARYSHNITHQLRILEYEAKQQDYFNLAWWIISLIRVRSLADFLVPAASDHSWSVIAGLGPKTCNIQFIEDVPTAKKLTQSTPVSTADLIWISDHLAAFTRMLEIQNFRLAVECLTTHQHQSSDRMMAAMLWSGIEALFAIQAELSFRLATFIATLLEKPGKSRRDLYIRVKKLYGIRSKAVHGAKLSGQQIHEHIVEVRQLLSRLVCLMIDKGDVFSEQGIENALFGVSDANT